MVAKQWTHTDKQVYTLSSAYPGYIMTDTQSGPVAKDAPYYHAGMITNADQGAVFSWRLQDLSGAYCALGTVSNTTTTCTILVNAISQDWSGIIACRERTSTEKVEWVAPGTRVFSSFPDVRRPGCVRVAIGAALAFASRGRSCTSQI